jgi:hypothetical protein
VSWVRNSWKRSSRGTRLAITAAVVVGVVGVSIALWSGGPSSVGGRVRRWASGGKADRTFGAAPALREENRKSVEEGVTGSKPERLSPLVAAPPFDREEFERDPEGYAARVEPARCYQTAAAAGADSIPLRALSQLDREVSPGTVVTLIVGGVPKAPVSFTAFAGGSFKENDLNSVTVLADARGMAIANLIAPATAGTRATVQVGSPMAVGNQMFVVSVAATPKEAEHR